MSSPSVRLHPKHVAREVETGFRTTACRKNGTLSDCSEPRPVASDIGARLPRIYHVLRKLRAGRRGRIAPPSRQETGAAVYPAQMETTHDTGRQTVRSRFMLRVFAVCIALALLSGGISLVGKWIGHSIAMAGHTDDATLREIVIGN